MKNHTRILGLKLFIHEPEDKLLTENKIFGTPESNNKPTNASRHIVRETTGDSIESYK